MTLLLACAWPALAAEAQHFQYQLPVQAEAPCIAVTDSHLRATLLIPRAALESLAGAGGEVADQAQAVLAQHAADASVGAQGCVAVPAGFPGGLAFNALLEEGGTALHYQGRPLKRVALHQRGTDWSNYDVLHPVAGGEDLLWQHVSIRSHDGPAR
ncbi:hypothetical protein [Pseudoduganella buxea]|nr:hypothetical protein [Pseudoduganella buxea]MTV53296.1 hypothetical protein [Pseudoduganella buxea]